MFVAHPRRLGIALVLTSAVMWSTAGLFVRLANLDIWQLVGWRSGFSAIVLGMAWAWQRRGVRPSSPFWPCSAPELAACLLATAAAITYIMALSWTSVANVMTIYATLPFAAAGVSFLWLRERTTTRFILAGALALLGIGFMVSAAFSLQDGLGLAASVVMTVCFASQLVVVRRYPGIDTLRTITWASALCLLVAWPHMPPQLPGGQALLACALYGVVSTGLGYALALAGSRLIGAGEAGLLSMLDVVLGPLWVWLFFGEQVPPRHRRGWVGGAVGGRVVPGWQSRACRYNWHLKT